MAAIKRHILDEARLLASQFRSLVITGPRQSGKTTLSRLLFPDKPYVNLETPANQYRAEQDLAGFINQLPNGAILDEVQRVPAIFRHLQEILDNNKTRGQFILTGSNNFLLQEQISQSLAGRTGYLQLLPFSFAELKTSVKPGTNVNKMILTGGYPEIWDQQLMADKWLGAYVQTYVQRDVRLIRNITNLGDFNRFLILCANRPGQLLNRLDIARSVGVDSKTIQDWLNLLESSYIAFTLQPWHNNLNKRVIKSPKLYFYDTGLLCHLLGITTQAALEQHPLYGNIFENWIISEIKKNRFNAGMNTGMYFFRDSAGNEVDLLVEREGMVYATEIKSNTRFNNSMLLGLRWFKKLQPSSECSLIYGGDRNEEVQPGFILKSWEEVSHSL